MPTLDTTAQAAVVGNIAVAWFLYLDILADPLRVTTFGADVAFTSTGDSDLDGHTFTAFGGPLIEVGDVSNSDSGSNTLSITLSGIVSMDTTMLNDIGDVTKWQGRMARIWFQIYDTTGVTPQGAIVKYYTGYMSKVTIGAQPSQQTIQLSVENYLAFTTQASNRSYLSQKDYDAADTSAGASIAAANGLRSASGGGGSYSGNGSNPYSNTGSDRFSNR
jgi:hypothetical protein